MLSVSFQCRESPKSWNLRKEGIHVSVSGEVTWEGGHLGLASSSCSHFSQSNSWLTSVVYGPHEVLENLDSSFGEQALDKVRVRERKTVQGDGEKNCGTRKQACAQERAGEWQRGHGGCILCGYLSCELRPH